MRRISNKLLLAVAALMVLASITRVALAVETQKFSGMGRFFLRSNGSRAVELMPAGRPLIFSIKGPHANMERVFEAYKIDRASEVARHMRSAYDDALIRNASIMSIESASKGAKSYRIAYDDPLLRATHVNEFLVDDVGRITEVAKNKEPIPALYRGRALKKGLPDLKSTRLPVIRVQMESLLYVQDKSYREKLAERVLKNLEHMDRLRKDDMLTRDESKFLKWYLKELINKNTTQEVQENNDREMRKLLDTLHERITPTPKPRDEELA